MNASDVIALGVLWGFFMALTIGVCWFLAVDKKNWREVARKDGYVYQEHKTLRKRRVYTLSPRPNLAWVKFETDIL